MSAQRRVKLLAFGFDAAEAAQIRRIQSYMDCGFEVRAFTMRRDNMNHDFEPFWPNVHLYETRNHNMADRVRAIAGSLAKLRRHRDWMAGTDVIVARNLDMLIIAAAAQRMIHPRPKLIYECLDIHGLMTQSGTKGRVLRAVERRLLARCSSLIVSSPAFLTQYFEPMQGWRGHSSLVENKLWIEGPDLDRNAPVAQAVDRPLTIGWVGTLRCDKSLKILAETAQKLGPKVQIDLHGIVHHHAVPDFEQTLGAVSNMTYHGPYDYPAGLAQVYGRCDLVWSQDLWQWGTNSTWLLPNRIYEASYFGCPSIAVDGSETGRRVAAGLGWSIARPDAAALIDLLTDLTHVQVAQKRQSLLAMPVSCFRQSIEEIRSAVLAPLGALGQRMDQDVVDGLDPVGRLEDAQSRH